MNEKHKQDVGGWSGDSKFVGPLSPDVDVVIYLDGTCAPDKTCFVRLRQYIDIIEQSLLGDMPRGKKLKPCKLHPTAPRNPVTHKCTVCTRMLADNMNKKRADKKRVGIVS